MAKYKVYGMHAVCVCIEVEADNEEDALKVAAEEYEGLSNFAGNGGMDKIVGVDQANVSIEPSDDVTFDTAEEI